VNSPAASLEAVPTYSRRRQTLALIALCVAVFEAALDQTFVLTVMPSIMESLDIPYTRINDAGWIVTGYLLGYTVATPFFGRVGDVRGRRFMYVLSLLLISLGSTLCVVTSRLDLFIAARVIMAAGAGALVPVAMAAGADMFPSAKRGRVVGIVEGAAQAGVVLGPIYGVGLAMLWNWRLIFLFNVPICLLLAAFTTHLLPARAEYVEEEGAATANYRAHSSRGRRAGSFVSRLRIRLGTSPSLARATSWLEWERVDYVGALFMAVALAGLTIGLNGDAERPVHWPWLLLSAVGVVALVFQLRRRRFPLVRPEFFTRPAFSAAMIANLLVGGALIIGMVEIPLYAYSLFGMTELQGGLLLIRFTLMIPVGAVIGGWMADRIGYRIAALLGFVVACAGFVLVSFWPINPTNTVMTRDLMITGFGFGLVIAPIAATVIQAVGRRWMATGLSLVNVARTMGMTIGLASLSSWGVRRFNAMTADLLFPLKTPDMSDAEYNALVDAYTETLETSLHTMYSDFFVIAAVLMGLAAIPAVFFYRRRSRLLTPGRGEIAGPGA
jgi:MFS family permease